MLFYNGPLAIIKLRKNLTHAKKIHQMQRWFVNEYGIFERDSETEYRHGKQLISFYNSHGHTIEQKALKHIEKLYTYGKDQQLIEYLYELYPKVKEKIDKSENKIQIKTIFDLFHQIAVETKHEAIDIDTDKYLYTLRAYNPKSIKQLIDATRDAKEEVDTMSPIIPKQVMPVVYVMAIVIVIAIVMQNAPGYMRELMEWLQKQGMVKLSIIFGFFN